MTPCPCHSNLDYAVCCEPFHTGQLYAPTAEDLMRSRYSAYALGHVDYLINTTHRDNPQYQKNIKVWQSTLKEYCEAMEFLGLVVSNHIPNGTTATVAFEAKLSQHGTPFILKEISHFVKIGPRWLYHSGQSETSIDQ